MIAPRIPLARKARGWAHLRARCAQRDANPSSLLGTEYKYMRLCPQPPCDDQLQKCRTRLNPCVEGDTGRLARLRPLLLPPTRESGQVSCLQLDI